MLNTFIIPDHTSFSMVGRYSRDQGTINYSDYNAALHYKHSNGGAKENNPNVKSYREIENTIILNQKAMNQLRLIASANSKLTYSDLIIFLIRQYRETHPNHDMAMTVLCDSDD